ncbi:Uncharacterized protein TCAP_02577 [Tolypocladium capitatum]|uniref:V-snare n=1 Tax=Tolypocladium capitatum TaxID=45235 RepID=A0A2K3QIX7_9HYPO|nr:Uncharacterized protein TCAP_02577 [Tolypocladium capitatum]
MATKRAFDDLDEGEVTDDEPSPPKRAKKLTGAQPRHRHQHSAIDPTWGQKYVFSNLEDGSSIPFGEESDFEDDSDAMAYLRSVRLEATGIPHLLVAPRRQIGPQLPPELRTEHDHDQVSDRSTYTDGLGDARGYYEDGAYMGLPNSEDGDGGGEAGDMDPETELLKAYCVSVLSRYHRLRSTLHTKPPPNAARRLSCARPTFAPPLGGKSSTHRIWSQALRSTDPHPLQLALMSKDSVLRVLRVMLGGKFLHRGYTLSERTSRWLWALLARLPEPWEMGHTEIAWVRDLGRRAVLLGRSLAEMAALRDELEDDMLGVNESVDASSGGDNDDDSAATDARAGQDPGCYGSEPQENPAQDVVSQENPTGEDVPEEQAGAEPDQGGQVDEGNGDNESVAMDLASDSDEGEAKEDDDTALEAAKKAFLSRLEDAAAGNEQHEEDPQEAARLRLRMNMRATLNMILTVAGEFYGQRDLLEFREPFVGM